MSRPAPAAAATRAFDPETTARRQLSRLMNNLVGPRPVALVSTVGADGVANLAPFSYFNTFSYQPPSVAIGAQRRAGVSKDSARNIEETGEFVVNVVSRELADRANHTSASYVPDVDEWATVDLTPVPSERVRPPRVAEAPAALECTTLQIVEIGSPDAPHAASALIIGIVERIVVHEQALDGDVPRPEVLDLVARMGGDLWCTSRDTFELARPDAGDRLVPRTRG